MVLQINSTNIEFLKEHKVTETCIEGQVVVSGVNSEYNSIPNVCWGLLSCNELICTTNKMSNVSFVLVAPAHG